MDVDWVGHGFCLALRSLKQTAKALKMDGWKTILPFWGPKGLFSGANLLLVSGRVTGCSTGSACQYPMSWVVLSWIPTGCRIGPCHHFRVFFPTFLLSLLLFDSRLGAGTGTRKKTHYMSDVFCKVFCQQGSNLNNMERYAWCWPSGWVSRNSTFFLGVVEADFIVPW